VVKEGPLAGKKKRIQAKLDEMAGKAKAKTGKATGNKKLQAKGAVQQVKGKVQVAITKLKTRH
jgi:uncharacterized protein YjbJ (UPF0337 family)